MKKNISINSEFEKFISQRLDRFLVEKFSEIPRKFFSDEIKRGNILINGKKEKPSCKIKFGDKIEINFRYQKKEIELIPQKNIPFRIIFRHPDFLIIDKPAGISVHPSLKESQNTLANGLIEKFPQIKEVGEDKMRPGIVHRLDKETSGLMVVALNQEAFTFLKTAFKNRKIHKKYSALVWGRMKKKEGQIEGYIGKSRNNLIKQSFSQNPEKVIHPKKSLTLYKVVKIFKDQTLVEAQPQTGRMHQIRIHFHSIGHPLVGDKKYQTKLLREKNKKYPHHQLRALELKFKYLDGEKYEFKTEELVRIPNNFKH